MWNDNTLPLSCHGQITLKQIDEFAYQSQTRSPEYQCTYQVLWKSTDIYLLSCGNENTDVSRADIFIKLSSWNENTDGGAHRQPIWNQNTTILVGYKIKISSKQQRPGPACIDVQAGQGFCCLHMGTMLISQKHTIIWTLHVTRFLWAYAETILIQLQIESVWSEHSLYLANTGY